MSNSRLLKEIQKHISRLEHEHSALVEAFHLISEVQGSKSKLKISSLKNLLDKPAVVKTGKRGRPAKVKPVVAARVRKGSNIDPKTGKRRRNPGLTDAIQETIKKHGKLMTNKELTDKLTAKYPAKSKSELSKYLSIILSNMRAKKILKTYKMDKSGKPTRFGLWGMASWFDGQKPKADYHK